MLRPLAILMVVTSPALGDTFAERWPQPVATDLAPTIIDPYPVQRQPMKVRHARAQAGFVCHRQTFYRGRHRYWRCQR